MKRRTLALFASVLCLATAFTACGNGGQQTSSSKTPDAASGEEEKSLYTEVGTYPIVNEPIDLSVFMPLGGQSDFETNDFTLYLEDLTGINLVFETAPADAAKEKINMLLSTGDYPDMIFDGTVDVNKYGVEEGILQDMTPYLDLMPNLKAAAELVPNIITDMYASDGKMYALPTYGDCFHCRYCAKMWANTDLLAEMGEEIPTTTEEFYNVLKKYKELYPDLSPLMGMSPDDSWNGDALLFLANSFTYYCTDGNSPYSLVMNGDTIEASANTPEFREALKYVAKLYDEGLLNEDAYTLTETQMIAYIANAEVPPLFVPSGSPFFALTDANPDVYSQYYPIAPLEGPDGVRNAMYFLQVAGTYCKITDKCQYPEAAARLIDYFYTWEGTLTSQAGTKGDHWTDPEPGDLGIEGEPALYRRITFYSLEPQNYCWQDRGPVFAEQSTFRSGEAVTQGADLRLSENMETALFKSTKDLYEPYHPTGNTSLPLIRLTPEELASIQTIGAEVAKFLKESHVQFITGMKDINDDAEWDAYVKGLDSIGLPTLIETYQSAYQRIYKK